jgi:dienelactone hydrolase
MQLGRDAAEALPDTVVYAGFSLGALPVRQLVQRRPGARGALLISGAVPAEDGAPWPPEVPVQVHAMADDEWMEEDFDFARQLVAQAKDGELVVYPGSAHLFADESVSGYDEAAAALLTARVLGFLGRVGS